MAKMLGAQFSQAMETIRSGACRLSVSRRGLSWMLLRMADVV
jgi:hypothetical protein